MKLLTTHEHLAAYHAANPAGGVLVPTMGALHAGHAALIRQGADLARSRGLAAGCMVTIFVNPTQFNDPRDLARYPRTLEADLAVCQQAGAAFVFAPADPTVIYPPNHPIPTPPLPAVATEPKLEDAFRPGHFAGVCQVVKRLFDLTKPAVAIFGEKDWQQLRVISEMVASLDLPIEIVSGPTVREPDGLALSSRNAQLDTDARSRARALSTAIAGACRQNDWSDAERVMRQILERAGCAVEYAVVRHAQSLLPLAPGTRRGESPGRAVIAARPGGGASTVRLIDNAAW